MQAVPIVRLTLRYASSDEFQIVRFDERVSEHARSHYKLDAGASAEKEPPSLPRLGLANVVHLQRRQLPQLAAHLLRQGQ